MHWVSDKNKTHLTFFLWIMGWECRSSKKHFNKMELINEVMEMMDGKYQIRIYFPQFLNNFNKAIILYLMEVYNICHILIHHTHTLHMLLFYSYVSHLSLKKCKLR